MTNKRKSTVRGRSARRINPLLPLAAVAAVAVGAFLILGRGGEIEGIQKFGDLSRDHTAQAVAYTMAPPLGGAHSEAAQNCGIYRLPVRNEPAVHSLEHGAVWITYQPGLSEADLERLKSLARGHTHVLLSPYPGIPTAVVAVAWGLRLEVQSADDPRLAQFVAKYENGPQNPEPGAACSGVGTPDEV